MLDKNKFESGLTFSDFINAISTRKEEWLKNYQESQLAETEVKRLSAMHKKFNVLALTDDWCGDSVRNLPVIARLLEALPQAQFKILSRDDNSELSRQFALDHQRAKIPTVVFMDQNFKVLALWIEEPANGPLLKEKFLSQPEGEEKYLSALREEVKKEIFSLLDEIKDR